VAKAPKAVKAKKRSAAQVAATRKFAAAGRAAQAASRASYKKTHHGKSPPRTAAQSQATKRWASAGRASQAAKRQGKKPAKAAAVMAPGTELLPGWSMGCNDWGPTCASAAVANHLLAATGLVMTEQQVMLAHMLAGGDDGADIPAVLEALTAHPALLAGGLGAVARFWRADEQLIVPGLVAVIALPHARHAVLSHPDGMVSWGGVRPWTGEPLEAWAIEWQY
jgi:hypothetical protein